MQDAVRSEVIVSVRGAVLSDPRSGEQPLPAEDERPVVFVPFVSAPVPPARTRRKGRKLSAALVQIEATYRLGAEATLTPQNGGGEA